MHILKMSGEKIVLHLNTYEVSGTTALDSGFTDYAIIFLVFRFLGEDELRQKPRLW